MKFQLCTCKRHPFTHGHFFNENGPYFRGMGMDHLSRDMFSQADALAFIQHTLDAESITIEDACALGRDQALLALPEECPSGLALYQVNEKARVRRLVTPEGERQLALIAEPVYSLKRLKAWFKSLGA